LHPPWARHSHSAFKLWLLFKLWTLKSAAVSQLRLMYSDMVPVATRANTQAQKPGTYVEGIDLSYQSCKGYVPEPNRMAPNWRPVSWPERVCTSRGMLR
jgi:hypothetical protein